MCQDRLYEAFGTPFQQFRTPSLAVPIGIEIEVSWRSYFPDLWVEGFPNLPADQMEEITRQCTMQERILLPKLRKTVECGIHRGGDKYWEFAFPPVSTVALLMNQVSVLKENDLTPGLNNSLHITLGGLHVDRYVYFIAAIAEAFSTSPERILSGFALCGQASKGWARKGRAGVFEKTGTYDMMYGYDVGAEIRLGQMPTDLKLMSGMLYFIQRMAVWVAEVQDGVHTNKTRLDAVVSDISKILTTAGLPNCNWKNPHAEPEIWKRYAATLPIMAPSIQKVAFEHLYE